MFDRRGEGHAPLILLGPGMTGIVFSRESYDRLPELSDVLTQDESKDAYIAHCWVSSIHCREWFADRGYLWPKRFDPVARNVTECDIEPKNDFSRKYKRLVEPVPPKGPRRAARIALDKLYPLGVPLDKSGAELQIAVNRYIEKQPSDLIEGRVRQQVSLDTVLRAAERK
jgi:hypothetical protein